MSMTKDKIYRLALASGFTPKEQPDNTMDLHQYVYEFADRLLGQHDMVGLDLIAQIRAAAGDPEGRLMQDQLVERIAELKDAHIITCLKQGYSLSNRGTGWWLSEPKKPYQKQGLEQVADNVIDRLSNAGLVRIDMPYNTAVAALTEGE